jgi:hypothetical protein
MQPASTLAQRGDLVYFIKLNTQYLRPNAFFENKSEKLRDIPLSTHTVLGGRDDESKNGS